MTGKNVNSFSFIEPLGHKSSQTKIERYWSSFWGPFALRRIRSMAYAKNSNMTFLPMEYVGERFDIDETMPEDTWIIDAFLKLVRTEFQNKTPTYPNGWPRCVDNVITISEDFLHGFLEASWPTIEDRMLIKEATPQNDSPIEIASGIYNILCNIRIGDKKNKNNNNREDFISRLESEVKNKSRLLFVIPGFPFKDQNRFRVPYRSDSPDMCEIAFMLRLYRLTQAIYQIHPYGADVVILTDGDLYHDIFGVDRSDVDRYLRKLINIRNKLNLQGTISFISLKEMIDRSSETSIAQRIISHIETKLTSIINGENNEEIQKAFTLLKQGMKWNCNSKNESIHVDDNVCWNILCSPIDSVDSSIREQWMAFDQKAAIIAIRYAAVNIMLRKTSLIRQFFPDAIRGTVHPKQNQFALAGNSSYAWNGVAWSDIWPKNIDDIKVRPYMDLLDNKYLNQVVLEYTHEPLFYTSVNLCENIVNAKKAFPLKQYRISEMVLRPFEDNDLYELEKIGTEDQNFIWLRTPQDNTYYKHLIDFRLTHYSAYGFGVYGVWLENKLIGQAGLQVVVNEIDQVEWVIFLGKDYVGKGLGTILLRYIISSCRENEMNTLYAIVKPDNEAAIAITKKFGGILIGNVVHYSESCVKFKIDLTRAG